MIRKLKYLPLLGGIVAILIVAWYLGPTIQDKINAVMAASTVGAVIVALFASKIESYLHSPIIDLQINKGLIDAPYLKDIIIRGKIKNDGDRTAQLCRLQVKELKTEAGHVVENSDIQNGYLEWLGGQKDAVSLNPGEDRLFVIGKVWAGGSTTRFTMISFIGSQELYTPLESGQYELTIKAFGDNFFPITKKIKIRFKSKDVDDIQIEPA